MKTLFKFVLLLLIFCGSLRAQPFSIGHRSISTTDPVRSRTVTMEVYYPADAAGNVVPFTQQPITAPILVFGHGFVMSWDAYANLWNALVPHGYLMAFLTTETGFSPNHLEFGKDLAFAVSYLQLLSNDPSDLFYQRLDSAAAVMGHSMGGGSAFLSVAFNPSIRAIATLAAAETTPSAIAASSGITIPALVIAGSNDCVTPPPQHQEPMYNALASPCKSYVSITGASHCQMAESNFYCNFGEATCTPAPSITRPVQHQVINRFLIPWLDFQLRNDCVAGADFDNGIMTDPAITYQRTCQLCTGTGLSSSAAEPLIRVYDLLSSGSFRFEWDENSPCLATISDMTAKVVQSANLACGQRVLVSDASAWAPGLYHFRLQFSNGKSVSRKLLVHGR